ncbi:MAG: acyl-CoA dehydrogenase FadE [Colwellia sp.]
MDVLIWLFFALSLSWFMTYSRVSLSSYTLAFVILMAIGTFFNIIGFVAWLLFAVIILLFNIDSFRQHFISLPLLELFKKIMPKMSQTEQEAIDAGTTWFEAELFRGNPDWKRLHNYPQPRLSAIEQDFLDGPVEELCAMVDDWHITHEIADLPPEIWQFLKDNKFFAMIIKKQYGGLEFCAYAQSRILQKITGVSSVLASTIGVPNSLGPAELLQAYGTDTQKNYYLPRLVSGEEIPCFALTSPEAGSDAGSIPDTGVICYQQFEGKEVLGMKLNWDKRYITLAPIATVLGLAFKLQDPEKLLGDTTELGITCALIPTNISGITIGRRHFPLNVPFQNGPTQGKDVFVPLDYIIGGSDMAGQGWRMLVECLSVGRAITLPSNSTGTIKATALATGAYSQIRRQFKLPIGKMEGIEEVLARIGGNAYLMDAVTTMSTGAIDLGEKPSVISAIAKYHLTEKMRSSITDAMDIHGGKGICMGPSNYLARGYQGAPIAITVEGANILTRSLIIYGQGAIRCHPYILAELQAANDHRPNSNPSNNSSNNTSDNSSNKNEEQALLDFDHALFGHVGFSISNISRSLWFSFTGSRFLITPFNDGSKRYYQLLTRFSTNLAMLSDIAMLVLGANLKRKERISARLGDVLSNLFLASATLKRYHDEGRKIEDFPLMQWAVENALFDIQQALDALINNFPNKWIAKTLRIIIFPFGTWLSKPNDETDHNVAQILQKPSATRTRLGKGQFITRNEKNVFGLLEQTLEDIIACEPIFEKVCLALGKKLPFYHLDKVAEQGLIAKAISEKEANLLIKTEKERKSIINVDDFDNEALVTIKNT